MTGLPTTVPIMMIVDIPLFQASCCLVVRDGVPGAIGFDDPSPTVFVVDAVMTICEHPIRWEPVHGSKGPLR